MTCRLSVFIARRAPTLARHDTPMSWTGLKKAINRAGAQVLLKTGHAEETVDLTFDYEEKRYRAMETVTVRLHKELRHYLETLRTLTTAQESMTLILSGFYGEDENNLAHSYHSAMKEVSQKCVDELEGPYFHTVLNPIERFNSYFDDVNEAIKKRNNKKIDYDALRSKVKRLEENPSEDPTYDLKLADVKQEATVAEEAYAGYNQQLKDELPKLVEMRIPYLNPLFESFVKIQLRFFNDNFAKLDQVQNAMDPQTRKDFINGTLEQKMDNILEKIRLLNITKP